MNRIVKSIRNSNVRKKTVYSDIEFIQGLLVDPKIQNELYKHWRSYFISHCKSEFFQLEDNLDLIIHNAFVVLWEKVRLKKIYVKDGVLIGKDDKPFEGNLTTYLMSIARNNNKELLRDVRKITFIDDLKQHNSNNNRKEEISNIPCNLVEKSPFINLSDNNVMREILSETIGNMPKQCHQILTMFYYKEMNLDSIMVELKSYSSKNALKTAKNKCMQKLKIEANKKYNNYLNS